MVGIQTNRCIYVWLKLPWYERVCWLSTIHIDF